MRQGGERSFLDSPAPIAFAHRGGADEAPENTLPAFEAALALGYTYIETDVRLTADGVLVAFHDTALDRVTDQTGCIGDLTLREVQAADAGYWFTPDGGQTVPFRGRGVTVPTLEEVLTRWPEVRVNIDPKADVCLGPLYDLLRRLDARERVCVGAFSDRRIARFRALAQGRVCTSMARNAVAIAWAAARLGRMPRFGADCIQIPVSSNGIRVVDAAFVRAAHRAGLQVHVWTVNLAAEMTRLLDLGVDGIMSDRPSLLRTVLIGRDRWLLR
ncbi:MAG: glycerophosphodiester phosphodiesterase [Chloroflexi bacterium]|nr:MAG: glycerophosphodiester phosphodiesterase [Chloroflexota bacterium]